MDANVYVFDILVKGVIVKEVHGGRQDIRQVLDFRRAGVVAGKVDTDNDVCAHLPGNIHREVVAHAAVYQHHSFRTHRRE